ncbi:CoxG family protein [Nitratireductor indicus]|uniref:CoxG family protein n=1 Tax=Nitratireductor indicus TaxID=721133 RepID=UPI0028769038|nr:carbon monoxide dehydrogenase subunit G [Nitratireductor indicus]MDS1138416.1 carbon monoxide dehydrogenase subunit G [Nitratireductor indicus]
MNLSGVYEVAASKTRVWEALTQAESLARILPGCDHLEEVGENRYAATVSVKVGPIRARFKGKVQLEDLDPCNGFRLTGSGDGGASGHARGSACIRLEEGEDGSTRIAYTAETVMNGKLAALGGRLVEAVSMRNIKLMMEGLERELAGEGTDAGAGAAHSATRAGFSANPAHAGNSDRTLSALLFQARLNGVLLALAVIALFGLWLG